MRILYIDTHLFDIDIKLFEDKKLIREEIVTDQKYNSSFLMPSIAKVINDEKIDEIIVVNGPGSFTGVRLGVTVAKTLAYTMEIPIKVVSYLELMNYSLDEKDYILGIYDNNGYFIAEVSNYQNKKDYYYLNNSEFKKANLENIVTDVKLDFDKILDFVEKKDSVNPHSVKPIYVKKIGVELGN